MAKKNTFNEVSNLTNKLLRSRFDPITKLALVVVVVVPIIAITAAFTIVRYAFQMFQDMKQEDEAEDTDEFQAIDTMYYEVCKVRATKDSLTQYVKFVIIRDNEFVDVTKSMKTVYPEIKLYKGRSGDMKGTAVLRDYDIIQVQQNLGDIKLVQVIGD